MCCVLQATQNFVIVFFGHVVSVSQAGQSNIFQLELHVVASALGMTQKKRCLALQVLNSCHQVGWAHLVQDNPAETIATKLGKSLQANIARKRIATNHEVKGMFARPALLL